MKKLNTSTRNGRAIDRLYKAVANYVKVNGGNVIVIGGIQLHEIWDTKDFHIAVKCIGSPPVFNKEKK